jgi:FkbM family methyltransferase
MSVTASSRSLSAQLDQLLGQDRALVAEHYRRRWAAAGASFSKPIVLHGTKQVGIDALRSLRRVGAEPVAFIDNNASAQGTAIEGIPVLAPSTAIARWGGEAVFVATLFNPRAVLAQLREAGARIVVPWTWMFAAEEESLLPYPGLELPERIFDNADAVVAAMDLWADEESRQVFLDQIRWMMTLDGDLLPPCRDIDRLYFDPDVVRLNGEEVFVDCGGFDGDSLEKFIVTVDGHFRSAHVVEPDPQSVEALELRIQQMPLDLRRRITVHRCAAGDREGTQVFSATGTAGSTISSLGNIEVATRTLDDLMAFEEATFVKVDVEGAELEALAGSRRILSDGGSTWAVMAYHRQSHLWEIPLAFGEFHNRDLFLRRYAEDGWERCVYALPRP